MSKSGSIYLSAIVETENPEKRKILARKMLRLRVKIEPYLLPELSDKLKLKIGYGEKSFTQEKPPPMVKKLIEVLNRDFQRVVYLGGSKE